VTDVAEPEFERLRRAATAGDTKAALTLAGIETRAGHHESARRLITPGAQAGDLDAMLQLGLTFNNLGQSDEAERWMLASATRGNERALRNLGLFYVHRGQRNQARTWLARAVDAGDNRALASLARLTSWWRPRRKTALARQAAATGDPVGAGLLGQQLARRYLSTLKLDRRAGQEARTLLREAASLEPTRVDFLTDYGLLLGVDGEWEEAKRCLSSAADAGNRRARAVLRLNRAFTNRHRASHFLAEHHDKFTVRTAATITNRVRRSLRRQSPPT
jgi:TPR repeat protein